MGKLFLPLKAKQKKEYYFSCIFCPDAHQKYQCYIIYILPIKIWEKARDRMQNIRVTDEYQQ